jgi:secondary thiamine-phosphate synthase enzyme
MDLKKITVKSSKKIEVINITGEVAAFASGISEGLVCIYCPHSTAGLTINEPESGLIADFEKFFDSIFPSSETYQHNRIDNNARAHLISGLVGSSLTIPVDNNKLALGTWQAVFFLESDGPRTRTVLLKGIKG